MRRKPPVTRRLTGIGAGALCAATVLATGPTASARTDYPSDRVKPNIAPALSNYDLLWRSDGKNDLHGTVLDARTLQHNDMIDSWINQHATSQQQFRALQNANYLEKDGSGYDQSMTIADGLGKNLGRFYVQGRLSGALPKVSALINSKDGTTGAYLSTSDAKKAFSYPRPYLQAEPKVRPVAGDDAACAPSKVNSFSLVGIRKGKPWADAKGNLKITRVAAQVDHTHQYSNADVPLHPDYNTEGLCTGGSFPSGHTTTAYQAGITLATLLPQVAPEILTRASEAGNNRIVLGVHYPLDIIGGRMDGEISLATRWSDPVFRKDVLEPARKELVNYLTTQCRTQLGISTLAKCVAADTAYTDNPYGGAKVPGGSAQVVTNRSSAMKVFKERMNYGFAPTSATTLKASVPASAENLLLTTYPQLTRAQRREVIAQTQIASGNPLDTTAEHRRNPNVPASWQRINLAAAMSATVYVGKHGHVKVVATGRSPRVIR